MDCVRLFRAVMHEVLEAEMTKALGAEKGESTCPSSATAPAIYPAPSSPS
jgi:transposase-like protein